jgi:uncharacterized protein (DUF2062 family)
MKARLQRVLQLLLHTGDTPHRTALAFGTGVVIAFSPFLGIHMLIALVVAFVFRLNRVAVLVGTYINNPWTIAPMYVAGTWLGCALLGVSPAGLDTVDWSLQGREQLRSLLVALRPYLWPFVLGNTILGAAAGALAYVLLRRALEARAQRRELEFASGGEGR